MRDLHRVFAPKMGVVREGFQYPNLKNTEKQNNYAHEQKVSNWILDKILTISVRIRYKQSEIMLVTNKI